MVKWLGGVSRNYIYMPNMGHIASRFREEKRKHLIGNLTSEIIGYMKNFDSPLLILEDLNLGQNRSYRVGKPIKPFYQI